MDNIMDAMNNLYQEHIIIAVANTLEAKEASYGQVTAATYVVLGNLKQRWELYRVAYDQAEEFVESDVTDKAPTIDPVKDKVSDVVKEKRKIELPKDKPKDKAAFDKASDVVKEKRKTELPKDKPNDKAA
ncbi:mediator of RNA polymerase II transcription subunit 32 [Tanacetum coccineum]